MLFVKPLPNDLISIPDIQQYIQDAVLITPRGAMAIHPHQIAMLVRGASYIEAHTTFGTVHHLDYDIPTQLGEDWRSLMTFMDQHKTATRGWTWHHHDMQGMEYYLHLNVQALTRVQKAICVQNALIPTSTVIETGDYALNLELDSATSTQLIDDLTVAMRVYWTGQ